MVDLTRPDFGEAWASEGEKLSPDSVKIKLGWVQEMMPYQFENFLQSRQDEAILYLLQKGVPEYSPTQEYTANKSVVVYQGNLYMATATVTGVLPTVTASWKRISPTVGANGAVAISSGGTGATTVAEARTNLGLGTASTANLPSTNGVVVRSADNTLISRILTGTSGNISITNPDGVTGNININVGTNVAQLDKDSSWTSKGGITLPKGSSGDRGVEVAGKIRYNTELQKFEGFDGTSWNALGAASEVEITTLSGDGITTTFTLNTPAFSESSTDVYIGGVYQNKGTYSVSGAAITFSEAPTPGTDNIQVVSSRVVDLGIARASQVSIEDAANKYTATTVEGALREITEYEGEIEPEASWDDVPKYKNKAFNTQAQALANRVELLRDPLNIIQLGIRKSTDITTSLNALIASVSLAGGGEITIPSGEYFISADVQMKSNVAVRCQDGARFKVTGNSRVTFIGTVSSEVNITTPINRGDYSASLSSTLSVDSGDIVYLKSCVNAMSSDAGEWRLGAPTANSPYGYFSEFLTVKDAAGSGITFADPVIFPMYPVDASGLTSTDRTNTTFRKLTPCINARWIGGTFDTSESSASRIVHGKWAVNCTVENIKSLDGARMVSTVVWDNCLRCEARKVFSIGDPSIAWNYSEMHGKLNRYKTIDSQDCGFVECYASYAAQAIDFTYSNGCSLRPYAYRNVTFSCFEGLTSHPGCYQEEWIENKGLNCFTDGLLARGLQPKIHGNNFYKAKQSADGSKAIGLVYGCAKKADVHGNKGVGFDYLVGIYGSPTLEWQWKSVDAVVDGNTGVDCRIGLYTSFQKSADFRNISFNNNNLYNLGEALADLGPYSLGIDVTNNKVYGAICRTSGYISLIKGVSTSLALTISGNKWYRPAGSNAGQNKYFYYLDSNTAEDEETLPTSVWGGSINVHDNHVSHFEELNGEVYAAISRMKYLKHLGSQNVSESTFYADGVLKAVPGASGITTVSLLLGAVTITAIEPLSPKSYFKTGDVVVLTNASAANNFTVSAAGTGNYSIKTRDGNPVSGTSTNGGVVLQRGRNKWIVIS